MLNGRAEHDGFGRAAEVFVRLADPLLDDIADDLDPG
jgi:hypothetical protein